MSGSKLGRNYPLEESQLVKQTHSREACSLILDEKTTCDSQPQVNGMAL